MKIKNRAAYRQVLHPPTSRVIKSINGPPEVLHQVIERPRLFTVGGLEGVGTSEEGA